MASATPPQPRTGPLGLVDEFIGPGATTNELLLQVVPLPFAAYFGWWGARDEGYGVGRAFAAAMLALDLVGGVATNSTDSAKRWYHREGQGVGAHMCFVVPHIAHVFLVAWLFRSNDWRWALLVAAYLVIAALVICVVARDVRRTVALLAYALGVWVDTVNGGAGAGVRWFVPLLYLKLLVAHLVDERVPEAEGDEEERMPIA